MLHTCQRARWPPQQRSWTCQLQLLPIRTPIPSCSLRVTKLQRLQACDASERLCCNSGYTMPPMFVLFILIDQWHQGGWLIWNEILAGRLHISRGHFCLMLTL